MTRPENLRRLDPVLQRDQLITQAGQPACERRSRPGKLLDQIVPAPRADRLVVPRVHRIRVVSGRHAVHGGHRGAYQVRVERHVGRPQVDPLIHPDLPAFQRREHASRGGAAHSRRRYPGGAGRLLERGRAAHLVLAGPVQGHLHRPAALRGVQPPHQSLFAPRDRAVRQPRRPAKSKAPGQGYRVHQVS